ncbi:MAG: tryptophan 7-halogenase [Bacteroidia bacterium]
MNHIKLWVGVKQLFRPGCVLCGNSTEFLDPVFSSGVTLATGSGIRAAKLTHKTLSGEKVDWMNDYENIRRGIDVFRTFVLGWYNGDMQPSSILKTMTPELKRQICSVLAGYVVGRKTILLSKNIKH